MCKGSDPLPSLPTHQALQSTDPEVTWDAPDKGRRHYLSKKLTEDEIKEDDFKVRGKGCMDIELVWA